LLTTRDMRSYFASVDGGMVPANILCHPQSNAQSKTHGDVLQGLLINQQGTAT